MKVKPNQLYKSKGSSILIRTKTESNDRYSWDCELIREDESVSMSTWFSTRTIIDRYEHCPLYFSPLYLAMNESEEDNE